MNLSLDPSSHSTPRKLRRFMGFLMNTEKPLRELGFDVPSAYRFAIHEHDQLETLRRAGSGEDYMLDYLQAVDQIETELHAVMGRALKLLRSSAIPPRVFSEYLVYHSKWSVLRESGQATGNEQNAFEIDSTDPVTMGVSWDQLLALHARLGSTALPHEFVAPFIIFLAGLRAGSARLDSVLQRRNLHSKDGFDEIAAQSLRDAVDFALQEKAQGLAQSSSGLSGDTEFQCMFMGVAFAQQNHTDQVSAWLRQGNYQARLLRVLFAMGFLAAENRQARRLTIKFSARIPVLVEHSFGKEANDILENFAAVDAVSNPPEPPANLD